MSRFFKFLILVAAIANIILIFVYDGQIPDNLPIPYIMHQTESEENAAEEPVAEETVLPAETEEKEPVTEEVAEAVPEEEEKEEEAEEEEALPTCRIISEDGSNVRSGPGPDYEILTSLPYDTVLVITGENDMGWFPVLAEDGTEGYVFITQLELPEELIPEDSYY